MIVCCLRGGMGNQLHQYAFGRYLSLLTGQDLGLNAWFYEPNNGVTSGRKNELGVFSFSADRLSFENWLDGVPIEVDGKALEYIAEADMPMRKLIEALKHRDDKSCALTGFWQSYLTYLDEPGLCDILQRELSYKVPVDPAELDPALRPIFESEASVAVHVRRGDYLRLTDRFHKLDREYYDAALDRIRQTVKTPEIFVFGDDIAQVKSENLFDVPVTYVDTGSLHTDFQLLQKCRHIIIANSTYSWWAAYLNRNEGKQIVAPKTYYTMPKRQAAYDANPRVLNGWHLV